MAIEIWDGYDRDGNKLGIDLYRDGVIPENIYHIVVEIFTFTKDNEILTTRRDENKNWELKWEITAGSILKNETIEEGAIRELKEETGIEIEEKDLHFIDTYIGEDRSAIYKSFLIFIDKDKIKIKLQKGETIDYKYLSYKEFLKFVESEDFAEPMRDRFREYRKIIEEILDEV